MVWTSAGTADEDYRIPPIRDLQELHSLNERQGEIMTDRSLTSNEKSWRCFHCDEVLTTEVDAANHFVRLDESEPACRIKAAGEFALLQALRNAEDQLARYRAEDSDVLRAMASMQSDYQQALRREEEKGYARGMRDAKLSGDGSVVETSDRSWPAPPRELRLTQRPMLEGIVEQPECWTSIDIGGHMGAILVVTTMADGSPVPPYAQQVIDWMVGKHRSAQETPRERLRDSEAAFNLGVLPTEQPENGKKAPL